MFWALFGAIYLCFGLPEVYRVLFEVFGMDPEDESSQPKLRRQLEDVDHVSTEFENKKLTWQDIVTYKASKTTRLSLPSSRIYPLEDDTSTYAAFYLFWIYSVPKMLSLLIRDSSELVSLRGCTGSGETYGILNAGRRSCKRSVIH